MQLVEKNPKIVTFPENCNFLSRKKSPLSENCNFPSHKVFIYKALQHSKTSIKTSSYIKQLQYPKIVTFVENLNITFFCCF